jgi:hypothetical protein
LINDDHVSSQVYSIAPNSPTEGPTLPGVDMMDELLKHAVLVSEDMSGRRELNSNSGEEESR